MNNCKLALLTLVAISIFSCDVINQQANQLVNSNSSIGNNETNKPSLSNQEVISGLKEALSVGIKNSVNITSVTDGFLKNQSIRLPFPSDAQKVKDKAIEFGLSNKVDEFETTLNRAAE